MKAIHRHNMTGNITLSGM